MRLSTEQMQLSELRVSRKDKGDDGHLRNAHNEQISDQFDKLSDIISSDILVQFYLILRVH